jgi:hypothetical protein
MSLLHRKVSVEIITVFLTQLHLAVERQNGERTVLECSGRQMVHILLGGRRFVSILPCVAATPVDLLQLLHQLKMPDILC